MAKNNYLSMQQAKDLIDNRPSSISAESVVQGLIGRGYTIQGLNDHDDPDNAGAGGLEGIAVGLTKGALKTATNVARTAQGAGQDIIAAGRALFTPETFSESRKIVKEQTGYKPIQRGSPEALAIDKTLQTNSKAEKIGFGAEQIGEFFIPSTKINQIEKVLAGGAKSATLARLTPIVGPKSAVILSNLAKTGTKMAVRAGEGGTIVGLQTGGDAEQVKSAATTGAIIPGVFDALAPIARKATAPFKGSFQQGVKDAFDSEGIKAPVSAISKSPFVQGTEAILGKGAFGKDILKGVEEATTQLDSKVNEVVEKIKPGKSLSDENIGKVFQEGLQEFEDKFKVTEGRIYDTFERTQGKSSTYGKNTKDALNTIIEEQGKDFFGGVDSRLTKMFNRLTAADNPAVKSMKESITELKESGASEQIIKKSQKELESLVNKNTPKLTVSELKATRSSVGEQLQRDPNNTALKRLYGALSQDMKQAVYDSVPFGGEELAASLDKLNKGYATGKAKLESNIAASISQSNPERIAQNIIKRNSADTLKTVKEMVGTKRFEEVPKAFLRQVFEGSTTRGKFDVDKLKKAFGEYDKETLAELFSPKQLTDIQETVSHLEKYQGMAEALKQGQKMASGSQTAFLLNAGRTGSLAAVGLTSLLSGNLPAAIGLLGSVAGEYGLTKFINTDLGRKILTEGFNPANTKLFKAVKGLSDLERATIVELSRGLLSNETGEE